MYKNFKDGSFYTPGFVFKIGGQKVNIIPTPFEDKSSLIYKLNEELVENVNDIMTHFNT
jgi:hypothetical protein